MSYMSVLQALEEGDVVTFNGSGGSVRQTSAELVVQGHTNQAIIELMNPGTGEFYRVKKVRDDELVLEYDRASKKNDAYTDWHEIDTIETVELIAEPGRAGGGGD